MEKNIFNGKEAQYLVNYFQSIGVIVNIRNLRRRQHLGEYSGSTGMIYISKDISSDQVVRTLLHEFAHHIHFQLEHTFPGSLEVIFDDKSAEKYREELTEVTIFVRQYKGRTANSVREEWLRLKGRERKLLSEKQRLQEEILEFEKIIKGKYPKFRRSKEFPECKNYLENSVAQYLLKTDYVGSRYRCWESTWWKFNSTVWKNAPSWKGLNLSIDNIETDFPNMPKEFVAYIRLISHQRQIASINGRLPREKNRYHYCRATELFARLVEGLYIDKEQIKKLAPNAYKRFYELLNAGYYKELYEVFVNLNLI